LIQSPTGDSCPACGSRQYRTLFRATDRLYHTTSKPFDVVECLGCRLLRLFPWPSPSELSTFYPETYWFEPDTSAALSAEEFYRRVVLRDHVRFVRAAMQPVMNDGPVLDVGCGGGLFGSMLNERGFRAIGLDLSSQAAAVAWRRNKLPTVTALLSGAPFRRKSCAGVTMFHVLEHLYDPASYLQAAHELLIPEGRLVIQVPNAACWQFLLFGDRWNGLDVPRHLIDFRAADMDRLLEHCGFEVVRHKYFSLRDNPAGLASSISPALDPMARRVRRMRESTAGRLVRDLVFFALVVAAVPFTILEAACRAGSTVMIEARKRP
jgi:SAM-dependent methyltransferase